MRVAHRGPRPAAGEMPRAQPVTQSLASTGARDANGTLTGAAGVPETVARAAAAAWNVP
jgi:hypothetical protein